MRLPTFPDPTRHRQVSTLVAALLSAFLLLALAPGARSETTAPPGGIDGPAGEPHVAGELLVAYEPGTPEDAEEAVVRESGARTLENPAGQEIRLISFSGVIGEGSEGARESALGRELQDLRDDPRVEAADYNYIREASFMPNDPRFNNQWGLTTARFQGAWDTTRGSGLVKIAIVDSGAYQGHRDIGKISAQKDFVENNTLADDDFGHGTHVTGIAAALTNNDRGMAGGCPRCSLLVAKVLNANGTTTDTKLVGGIDWSMDHGADVVNLSLAGPGESSVLEAAVNDASAGGAVVVASAGNYGTTRRQYPAAYPRVIAVSATTGNDKLAGFSSHGDWVDLAAPGVNILSTLSGGGYGGQSGTSMSAPFVSGLAGLLASQGKSASEVRRSMQTTATDLGPAWEDPLYGRGRIDAARAVR